jgi:hypothetical protein
MGHQVRTTDPLDQWPSLPFHMVVESSEHRPQEQYQIYWEIEKIAQTSSLRDWHTATTWRLDSQISKSSKNLEVREGVGVVDDD